MNFLSVNRLHLCLAEPQHQVGVVDAVAHQGRDIVQHQTADGFGKISSSVHGDNFSDASLFDRLFGQCHARIEIDRYGRP